MADELKSLSRDELNAKAAELGIADAEQLPNIPAVIAAIEAAQAGNGNADPEPDTEAGDPPAVFLRGGVKLDPNGKPV